MLLRFNNIWTSLLTLSFLALSSFIHADKIRLKTSDSWIEAPVLVERADWIAVDVGYTILKIPRDEIVEIEKEPEVADVTDGESAGQNGQAVENFNRAGLYRTAKKSPPEKQVLELVNELGEGVVQVRTPSGLGSGFFINEDGYLITNFHVIEGETQISIEVYHVTEGQLDRTIYPEVRILAMNKFEDLALLKIEPDDEELPEFEFVFLGDSEQLSVGEGVFAIGSPLGLERTVTEGIISTRTRQIEGELYLQTTTQINPGNSGGPLFNMRGEVIGVTNMKMNFSEGLGFAIPISAVKYFLEHRDAYAYDNGNPSNAFRYLDPPRPPVSATSGASSSESE